ncbi:uncharacterized protein TRIREDRAFT_54444 [Trichoderma reesei QM6a]|jgi:hypothetical protein|uniref:Predicted protein n=2 Tax=Hypocrea jecorina TaxID=51453 RepID=G0R6W1_HYPJQ|nr:uncharacterized protein TRIREDRAFT_54444 [Trichoderma reesei QM6a]EGR53044.1 predicted protein [Trichoderma reesei QM6a]ETR98547.1 hypothetical protein M419DRAFT_88647 [Trichoderma reesei RUT C-30]
MTSKWSSSCPKQKANRIRNNQRRHRAKVKAHISSLESELAESRRQLAFAENRIKALAAEVERLQSEARRGSPSDATTLGYGSSTTASQIISGSRCCQNLGEQRRLDDIPTYEQIAVTDLISMNDIERDPSDIGLSFASRYDSPNLPPQQPGESTTSCTIAYGIIAQQNLKGLGIEDIHQWLHTGYRRALRDGDGCTVVNSLVYSLIDHLSPV